jgi:hypothetical protein
MQVLNVHTRILDCDPAAPGALLASLGSRSDRLWPELWPPIRLYPGLQTGAKGGHGPIRYTIESLTPGAAVRFKFTGPHGFDGFHEFTIEAEPERQTRVTHRIMMQTHGLAQLSWPLLYEPLHDALIEDAFGRIERELGLPLTPSPWSRRVRLLRWIAKRPGA